MEALTRGYRAVVERNAVVALSVILLLLDHYLKMSIIFWTIGLIVLVIGVVFLLVDQKSRTFGGHKYKH
jgi:phosphate starvation-inducible membrane PsiE